jgi:hypothetical protein
VNLNARVVLPRSVAAIALAVIGLNLFDVFFTLLHLDLGAEEANPIMRELLEEGPLAFALGKHFLVGTGVVALAAKSTLAFALDALRFVALPAYALVAAYHVVLLGFAG